MRPRVLAVALALLGAAPAAAGELTCLALDDANTLVRFDCAKPEAATAIKITGAGGTLIGIDQRPADRRLYALSDANDLYVVDPVTGAAESVGTLTIAFDGGTRSGFDFTPQLDRLRLLGGNGQNMRVNVVLGATASDTPLRYAPGDAHAGTRPAIAAAAYTRSLPNAPVTKLFDVDAGLDVLALQDPPNDGVLVTVGPLGIDVGPLAGFDVVSEGDVDRAFLVSAKTLYEIDLATGKARALGTVAGAPYGSLIGLAVLAGKPEPAR